MNNNKEKKVNWRQQNVREREDPQNREVPTTPKISLQEIIERNNTIKKMQENNRDLITNGIITDIKEMERHQIYGRNSLYGKNSDPFVGLKFNVIFEEKVVNDGFVSYSLSNHPKSYLSRFLNKYNDLKKGMTIKIQFDQQKSRWNIII